MESFCILCDRLTEHGLLYGKLKRCNDCLLVSADIDPREEELIGVYGKDYFFKGEYLNYLEEKEVLQKNFRKWIPLIKRFAPHGKLFEIGSAYGFFLELARKYWEVKGIDISEDASNYGKSQGLDVEYGDFLSIPVEPGKYNIFCLWDTIEHLKMPHLYIKKISEVISPGGILCLTTGDIDAMLPRIQKGRWRMIHPPTHLYYFSKKTLTSLLAQYQFETVYISYVGFYRSIKRVLFNLALFKGGAWKRIYQLYSRLEFKDFSCYLNAYDILFVIARKES